MTENSKAIVGKITTLLSEHKLSEATKLFLKTESLSIQDVKYLKEEFKTYNKKYINKK